MVKTEAEEKTRAIDRRSMLKAGLLGAAAFAFHRVGWASAGKPGSIPQVKLSNGVMMPALGFGTYGLRGDVCTESVADAINAGYRLIDTAKVYQNEEAVGAGIRKSGIDRKSLFVTSKIWVEDSGYEPAKRAFQTTLDKLQLEYLDLYLIHRPRGDVQGSWRAMEELNTAGKIKAIGVSNFDQGQLAYADRSRHNEACDQSGRNTPILPGNKRASLVARLGRADGSVGSICRRA